MEDRTESLAPLLGSRTLRCVWARGQPRVPFHVTERERPCERPWSADGSTLWTRGRAWPWWQWDPQTGRRLRSASLPADLRVPILDEAVELYSARTKEQIDAIDLAAIGDPKLAGFDPGKGRFVVGTERGIVVGFELIP